MEEDIEGHDIQEIYREKDILPMDVKKKQQTYVVQFMSHNFYSILFYVTICKFVLISDSYINTIAFSIIYQLLFLSFYYDFYYHKYNNFFMCKFCNYISTKIQLYFAEMRYLMTN